MRNVGLLNDTLVSAEWNQKPIHHFLRSGVSLLFDFLPQAQAVVAPLFPSFEHIASIRIKATAPFSTPLWLRRGVLFEPALNGSCRQANTVCDFGVPKSLSTKGNHLFIAVLTLCMPCEACSLRTQIWCWLPILHGNKLRVFYEEL